MTSRFMQEKWAWIDGSNGMLIGLLDTFSDGDLAYNPGGQNMTLGALCREMGETEHTYIESIKTLKCEFSYRNTEAGLDSSVARLKTWIQAQHDEMKTVVSAFSDEDFKKVVDRSGYPVPVETQLDIYLQALLIFFGKAVIYCKAMNKPLPKVFQEYIG